MVVAGVAVVLTHRERTSSYRSHLFEQQLSVLMELADASGELTRQVLLQALVRVGTGNREPLLGDTVAREVLIRLRQRAHVILPNDVNLAIGRFMDAVYEVTGTKPPGVAPTPARIDAASTGELVAAYDHLRATIRSRLGVDALTEETLALMRRSA